MALKRKKSLNKLLFNKRFYLKSIMQSPTVQKMFTLDLTKNNSTDLNMNDNTGISRNDCKDLTNNGSNVLTRNDDSSGITSNDSFDLTRNNNTIQESHDEDSVNLNWLMNLSAASIFPSSSSHQTNTKGESDNNVAGKETKPGLTYTELIEKALKENGELTVSEIYKWIYSKYPYYKKNDGRWKNSIRHNLSINPQFRKGNKCTNGGHYWTLNKEYDEQFKKWQQERKGTVKDDRKRKAVDTIDQEETIAATKSILLESDQSLQLALQNITNDISPMANDPNLVRVATDILNGIERQVEVEYMENKDNEDSSAADISEEELYNSVDSLLSDSLLFGDLGFHPHELFENQY